MSLREQVADDVENLFLNEDEFATVRDFRLADGSGGYIVKPITVLWFPDTQKRYPIGDQYGVRYADIICCMKQDALPSPPIVGQLIFSPANQPWRIDEVWNDEGWWKLALTATRT